jgi:NTE family protein
VRVGLVLGAGGATGGAFHAGVLAAIEGGAGWDPRRADIILGTSAGSVTAAMLRAGFRGGDLAARLQGRPLSAEGAARLRAAGLGPVAPAPARPPAGRSWLGPSAPAVLMAAARRPWAVRPMSVVAGLIPEGRVGTAMISDSVGALLGDRWPDRPMWIAAVHLEEARLVLFGRPGAPSARPAEAVAASCAVPGWFRPVRIGPDRYVDGGVHSLTNLIELSRSDLDVVVVSAPMGRAGRHGYHGAVRHAARAQLAAEAAVLRRQGVTVVAFQPTTADQAVMGPDPMDARRRGAIVAQVKESVLGRLERGDVRRVMAGLAAGGPV